MKKTHPKIFLIFTYIIANFPLFNPSPALGSFDLELRRGVRADPPSISHESAVNLYFLIVGCNYLVSLIILSFVSRF